MTIRPLARLAAAASIATLAVLLAACSASEPDANSSPGASPSVDASSQPSVKPSAPETPEAIPATCENIIAESTVQQFADAGWTAKNFDFMIGETVLQEGAYCVWGNYSVPGSDNVAIFGWSTVTNDDAAAAQQELITAGWIREKGDSGVYITENPEYAIGLDENGYGMTYLFGDGWVTVSETKQSLQLVGAPRA